MIESDDTIKFSFRGTNEKSVGGDGADDVESFGASAFDGRGNDRFFFMAKKSAIAGMWIESGHRQTRGQLGEPTHHGIEEGNLFLNSVDRDGISASRIAMCRVTCNTPRPQR